MSTDQLPRKLLWRERPTHWKVQRTAPKKTWTRQIEEDLKSHRLNLSQARQLASDRNKWKATVMEPSNKAPTAAYWLRGQPPPPGVS